MSNRPLRVVNSRFRFVVEIRFGIRLANHGGIFRERRKSVKVCEAISRACSRSVNPVNSPYGSYSKASCANVPRVICSSPFRGSRFVAHRYVQMDGESASAIGGVKD